MVIFCVLLYNSMVLVNKCGHEEMAKIESSINSHRPTLSWQEMLKINYLIFCVTNYGRNLSLLVDDLLDEARFTNGLIFQRYFSCGSYCCENKYLIIRLQCLQFGQTLLASFSFLRTLQLLSFRSSFFFFHLKCLTFQRIFLTFWFIFIFVIQCSYQLA